MITFGVCDALFSMAFGSIIKLTGRIPIFLLGAVLNVTVIAVLFNWMPNPDQNYVFFILAGLWGTADAVWQTQINCNKNHFLDVHFRIFLQSIYFRLPKIVQ
jgi:hypothetical protein